MACGIHRHAPVRTGPCEQGSRVRVRAGPDLAGVAQLADDLDRLGRGGEVDVGDDDVGALAREQDGALAADAANEPERERERERRNEGRREGRNKDDARG